MNNFSYELNFTESIMISNEVTRLYEYDILMNNGRLGWIRLSHNLEHDEVTATLRVKYLDNYTASGTARKMLEDLLYNIINHDSKATFLFNTDDAHTVALLEMNGIDKDLIIKG